jgi:hypothetical protein
VGRLESTRPERPSAFVYDVDRDGDLAERTSPAVYTLLRK